MSEEERQPRRKTTKKDFEPDRTYSTTRNIGAERYSQALIEVGEKIPYPVSGTPGGHKSRTYS